jgi:hypothetical protein
MQEKCTLFTMYKQKKELNPETLRLTNKEQGEKSRWMLWAELMKRVFQEDVGCCVHCGGRMELHAVVIRPPATLKVLAGLFLRRGIAPDLAHEEAASWIFPLFFCFFIAI